MTESSMWVEKYRPTKISSIINQKEIVGSLRSLLKNTPDMPHLLFSGSAGVGKTTAALCIAKQILGELWKEYTLELNTSDAQTALRRIIEDTARYCRFILIANNISKIIDPIQSRCAVFKFTSIPEQDIINHLEEICKKEKVKYN